MTFTSTVETIKCKFKSFWFEV